MTFPPLNAGSTFAEGVCAAAPIIWLTASLPAHPILLVRRQRPSSLRAPGRCRRPIFAPGEAPGRRRRHPGRRRPPTCRASSLRPVAVPETSSPISAWTWSAVITPLSIARRDSNAPAELGPARAAARDSTTTRLSRIVSASTSPSPCGRQGRPAARHQRRGGGTDAVDLDRAGALPPPSSRARTKRRRL